MSEMIKINKRNILSKNARISYLQILILVVSSFAIAYLIYESTGSVSAEETPGQGNYVCCEETNQGNICQYIKEDQCKADSQKAPTLCDKTNFCKEGCCIDSKTGICNVNTPEGICNGIWKEVANCNFNECDTGCCILGSGSKWTNENNCRIESSFLGIPIDFKGDINSEIECIFLTQKEEEGACVYESGDEEKCLYTTRENCFKKTRNENSFYANTFCSNPELNSSCVSKDHTGCVDGKEGIYWFDSCGNQEDLKEECNLISGGVCGIYREGIDKKSDVGDYTCRDVNCYDTSNGNDYKNGEAWCEYDGTVGEGKDPVGSRHVKHYCYMGEEIIEPCADYRNEICVSSESKIDGESFSEASCRVNNWRSCFEYNIDKDKSKIGEKCNDNPDCFMKDVNVADKFKFSMCAPKYPPGFDLAIENSAKSAEMLCGFASQKCTVIYIKRVKGWKCSINCECEEAGFAQKMNDLCISMGDCGAYTNIEGVVSDEGYSVSRSARLSKSILDSYKKFAQYKSGQKAEPGDLSYLGGVGIEGITEEDFATQSATDSKLKKVVGIAGLALMTKGLNVALTEGTQIISGTVTSGTVTTASQTIVASKSSPIIIKDLGGGVARVSGGSLAAGTNLESNAVKAGADTAIKAGGAKIGEGGAQGFFGKIAVNPTFQNFLAVVQVAGALISVQNLLSVGFGIDSTTAWIIAGIIIVLIWVFISFAALGPIGLVIAILMFAFGIGKSKKKIVEFKCLPWQPPAGDKKSCESCNPKNELDTPCSQYRCSSLGLNCELINPGTDNELCIYNAPSDVSAPKINPLLPPPEGYQYVDIDQRGFRVEKTNGDCIDEFVPVSVGIQTDKASQCKIGENPMDGFENMNEYFSGSSLYKINHTTILNLPSASALKSMYNLTEEQIKQLGNINLNIKCKGINGVSSQSSYVINTCINPGPDTTAPIINKIDPEKGFLKKGNSEKYIELYTNEPAECRWSKTDKEYDNMENQMECQTDLEDFGLYGWSCNTTLTNIGTNSSNVYFRCKDQPWLEENGEGDLRNANSESKTYEIVVSKYDLKIEDIKPVDKEEIIVGVEPITVNLRLKTSGGAENGKAICSWSGNGYSDRFTETNDEYHSYEISQATRGIYNMKYTCEDIAGNIAELSSSFEISIDSNGPKIVRMYYDSGLKIVTNENAECRYSFERNFDFENATIMSGDGIEHAGEWQLRNYYLQCADDFGNKGNKLKLKTYNLV